jgi:beta-glucoside operon transcriptional antiterminator
MRIYKIINHNIVISQDESGNEVILMGRGIAYQKKKNNVIDEALIEKRFYLEKEFISDNFIELLREIPEDVINVTHEVIEYIKASMGCQINNRIYLTLLDHINYAVVRYLQGIQFNNMLLVEIKHLYKREIEVAQVALSMINQRLMVNLPEDEAAFIALHIVNAQLELDITEVTQVTNLINEILNIVRYQFKIKLDETTLDYDRFVTHLKFFSRRLIRSQVRSEEDVALYEIVKERYPSEYKCVKIIESHIKKVYDQELSLSEKLYLMMHMTRIKKEV